jgi:hypothetical protein
LTTGLWVLIYFLILSLCLCIFLPLGSLFGVLGDYPGQCEAEGLGGAKSLMASRFPLTPTSLFQGLLYFVSLSLTLTAKLQIYSPYFLSFSFELAI